jgi:hypothetical protein
MLTGIGGKLGAAPCLTGNDSVSPSWGFLLPENAKALEVFIPVGDNEHIKQ